MPSVDKCAALRGLAESVFMQVLIGNEGKMSAEIQSKIDDAFDTLLADSLGIKRYQREHFKATICTLRETMREITGP